MECMLKVLIAVRKLEKMDFVAMDESDWSGFAGAEEGSLICHGEEHTLILAPDGTLAVIDADGREIHVTATEL